VIRASLLAFGFLAAATPALAVTFGENDQGQIEFTMPSGNIGCIYTPAGGTDTYEPMGGGPELSCDRVEPSYVRVMMGPSGKPKRYNNVGDASCCGSDNVFDYGEVWKFDGFRCTSSTSGLQCTRGGHGFTMSRKAITAY
jgi:hypothetical protein